MSHLYCSVWKTICPKEIKETSQPDQNAKDIAPTLWGNPILLDLAENFTQCRECHREQLCNWSKVGRSLVEVKLWASMRMQVEWEWEREILHKGPSLSPVSLTHERGSLIWPPQVKPSDLLTFDRLQSSTLCQIFSQIEPRWIST